MRRLRTLFPGLVGLGLAATILWKGGAHIEQQAEGRESFALRVSEPAPVIALGPRGFEEVPSWHALIQPAHERGRVEILVDGLTVEAGGAPEGGELSFTLEGLTRELGWHFVEVGIERRGGRRDYAVDPVLVGRFADPIDVDNPELERARPCAAALTASPAFISSLIEPLLRERLLPALRDNEHMGLATKITTATLELREDVVAFELELEGVNTLAVSGIVMVGIIDERKLHAELVTLSEVDFRGELRNQAQGLGIGGGALIGGLIAGPLAPVGAAAGWYAANKFVTKKAREVVQAQVEKGLAQLSGVELLPAQVELVPGKARSRVNLGFCDQTGVRPTGLVAGLWIQAAAPETDAPRFDLHTPGPLVTGATPTIEALGEGEDLRVELSIDGVNALIYAWTETGLLAALIGERRSLERANAELEAWTELRLRGLTPTRPPTLSPAGGPEAGWRYGIGGLSVEVEGVEAEPWGEVQIAAAGTLSPHWDPEAGSLSLVGGLDRLDLTCVQRDEASGVALLQGCFSEVLEAAEVRTKIDERLRPGAGRLPTLALRELLSSELSLSLDALELSRPRPGVLRLSSSLSAD